MALKRSESVLARNAEFVHQHKEELEKGSKAFKITGLAFLARGIANIINSGGVQMENLDSFAFGFFLLHAHIKIKNLVNGYTTRSAAEEMCSALSAVGECLSLFGWVVTFEVIGIVDSFTFELLVYVEAIKALLFNWITSLPPGKFVTVVAVVGLIAFLVDPTRVKGFVGGCREYFADKYRWWRRAVSYEAHDVKMLLEFRRFKRFCNDGGGEPVDRRELKALLRNCGYAPTAGQVAQLMQIAAKLQGMCCLTLPSFLAEVERLLGKPFSPGKTPKASARSPSPIRRFHGH